MSEPTGDTPAIDLSQARVLLVDDSTTNLRVLRSALEPEGYTILVATSGSDALRVAAEAHPHLVLLDVMMPDLDGFATSRQLRAIEGLSSLLIIFVTARSETDNVVAGFDHGGVDYIVKPFRTAEVRARVRTHLERSLLFTALADKHEALQRAIERGDLVSRQRDQLATQITGMAARESERWGLDRLIGGSPRMRKIIEDIRLLEDADRTSVLISGESGTGKELVARAIHHGSTRRAAPFVAVNCSAVPAELAESLFFGHVRGAFTGADRDRAGHFREAHGGTLFLDEVGDMPAALQGKLLRALEERTVTPVGASTAEPVDVRIVAASNRDLRAEIAAGSFRQDLYFRLAAYPVEVPPLRERHQDIAELSGHFVATLAREMGRTVPELTAAAVDLLSVYHYPGNVRELRNVIERALIESRGGDIDAQHIHFLYPAPSAAVADSSLDITLPPASSTADQLPFRLADVEVILTKRALCATKGNIAATARLLGTNRPRVYRVIREHDLSADDCD